jgi:large subunit ribosomal protein L14
LFLRELILYIFKALTRKLKKYNILINKKMLITRSKLKVKDNSGASLARSIQIQRSKRSQKPCRIGDFLKVTVKGSLNNNKGSGKKKVFKAERLRSLIVIQTKKALRRSDGSAIRFNSNSGVTVDLKTTIPSLLFKRVTTVVPFELKKVLGSVLNLAKSVI